MKKILFILILFYGVSYCAQQKTDDTEVEQKLCKEELVIHKMLEMMQADESIIFELKRQSIDFLLSDNSDDSCNAIIGLGKKIANPKYNLSKSQIEVLNKHGLLDEKETEDIDLVLRCFFKHLKISDDDAYIYKYINLKINHLPKDVYYKLASFVKALKEIIKNNNKEQIVNLFKKFEISETNLDESTVKIFEKFDLIDEKLGYFNPELEEDIIMYFISAKTKFVL